ncbi:hypothetical protein HK104_008732 [Borealophlyctis nickersoniae]|nr:hypothetical protein HK104_008732 [Borealophlyctis nickersoniae]
MLLDEQQVAKASKALIAFHANKEKAAEAAKPELGDAPAEETVELVVTTKKMPDKMRAKPQRIPIRHSLLDESCEVCLFTKDPQRTYKDLLQSKGVTRVARVMGVSKLKAKFKPYEAKRQLLGSYDLFLADERVLPVLPPLLGKSFFERKRHPAPVDMTKGNLSAEIDQAINSTYLHFNKGVCNVIKVGKTSFTPDQVTENVMAAMPVIARKIPQKWKNILSIHLKTSTSAALPLYLATSEGAEGKEEKEKVDQSPTGSKRKVADAIQGQGDGGATPKVKKVKTPAVAAVTDATPVKAKAKGKASFARAKSSPARAKGEAKKQQRA